MSNPVALIAAKRDGYSLTAEEIGGLIEGYTSGNIPDYQMAAFAMAVFCRGMSAAETAALTAAMLHSGRRLAWPSDAPPIVDKHSTGGVGDKVSLILAPLLACCGVWVPMISGRGLGPTGGTLDKLESIHGFRTNLSVDEVQQVTSRVGCVITGASEEIAPADRKLYQLRDVTATVPSLPLITASIMSKKLAESLDALVLDVKWGRGAFMKTEEEARALARAMVATGQQMQVATRALLTDMNQPLGRAIGNANEVEESLATLRGEGPADLVQVSLALGGALLAAAKVVESPSTGVAILQDRLDSGAALEKFAEMVAAQGGDLQKPRSRANDSMVEASRGGAIQAIDNERLGYGVIELGGGRRVMTDQVDPAVGFEVLVRIGDKVEPGQPLIRVFAHRHQRESIHHFLRDVVQFTDEIVEPPVLIQEVAT